MRVRVLKKKQWKFSLVKHGTVPILLNDLHCAYKLYRNSQNIWHYGLTKEDSSGNYTIKILFCTRCIDKILIIFCPCLVPKPIYNKTIIGFGFSEFQPPHFWVPNLHV